MERVRLNDDGGGIVPPRLSPVLAPFEAVLFDAGFTLLEPVRPVAAVYAEAARAFGTPIEEAAMAAAVAKAFAGSARSAAADDHRSSEASERAAWSALTREVAVGFPGLTEHHAAWLAALVDWFDRPASWRPAPGALPLLRALRAAGKRTAIVSNWHGALFDIADGTGISEFVAAIFTSAGVGRRKPHPAMFEAALDHLQAAPHRTAHVGDSLADDVQGARRAGIAHIFFLGSAPSGPDFTKILSLQDLLDSESKNGRNP